ncbi:MAG: glycoside hydrolase family 5 protein [Oscillospiraceae bacterium]|nr:glycoside hydrolase family 5 protein [Oscillospiraceae bacterium]
MKVVQKFISILLTLALIIGLISAVGVENITNIDIDRTNINTTISAKDFVRSIGAGWNLGNAFDAVGDSDPRTEPADGFSWLGGGNYANTSVAELETAWVGMSAIATDELIQEVHDAGFRAIRIPVTWHKAVYDRNNWQIRADWMARIREVVDMAYNRGMHVLLNTHHENSWIGGYRLTANRRAEDVARLTRLWEQIAPAFADYSERLMFAGLNEPRGATRDDGQCPYEWAGGTLEMRQSLNVLNQAFVNTVRATGGNNAHRFLIVPTHGAGAQPAAFEGFVFPTDSANDRLILAVHTYSPFAWAHNGEGMYTNDAGIRGDLTRVYRFAESLGVPVILSEWGSVANGQSGNHAQRVQHAYDYVRIARELGMATFWWDNNVHGANNGIYSHVFALFDRTTRQRTLPDIIGAIMDGMVHTYTGLPSEPEFMLRLSGAAGEGWWPQFHGEWVPINGDGTFTARVHAENVTEIIYLGINNGDVEIPTRFSNARISIDTIFINNLPISHNFPESELVSDDEVDAAPWVGRWRRHLISDIVHIGEYLFGLIGGQPMGNIEITFTISGVLPCAECGESACVCDDSTPCDDCGYANCVCYTITVIDEEERLCTHCGATKLFIITMLEFPANPALTQRREAAKRNTNGELLEPCVYSFNIVD